MLACLACFLTLQVPLEQPPRLRTVLPNGAVTLVEKVPGAKTIAVQLFASSRGTEETPITNGLRHLLEHLIAKGPKGDLDRRLERAGGFLTAETTRDAMVFKLSLPVGKLDLGIKCLTELMQAPDITTESIKHEADILDQEAALRDDSAKFSAAAWFQAYGESGLDPAGNLDVIRDATPAMLKSIHKIQFSGSNLVIAVAGDLDLDKTTNAFSSLLMSAPKTTVVPHVRKEGVGGTTTVEALGLAYAVPVPGFRKPETVARLAAAVALASESDHCYVIYTPSNNPGLITIGRSEDKPGLARAVSTAKPEQLYSRGRILAKAWISRMLNTPEQIAGIRGLLIVNAIDLKPDTLIENLNAMTFKQFTAAVDFFRSSDAIVVNGR